MKKQHEVSIADYVARANNDVGSIKVLLANTILNDENCGHDAYFTENTDEKKAVDTFHRNSQSQHNSSNGPSITIKTSPDIDDIFLVSSNENGYSSTKSTPAQTKHSIDKHNSPAADEKGYNLLRVPSTHMLTRNIDSELVQSKYFSSQNISAAAPHI